MAGVGWTAPTELEVWPSSEKVWRAGAARRRSLRVAGGILLLAAAVAVYAWSVTPFGGPESSQRYFFLLLQWVGATLFAVGVLFFLFTFPGAYTNRISVSADGIRVHQRSVRTGRNFPYQPEYGWALLASRIKLIDYSESGNALLATVPYVMEQSRFIWGGLDRDAYAVLAGAAAIAGYTVRKTRRGRTVVHSFIREQG